MKNILFTMVIALVMIGCNKDEYQPRPFSIGGALAKSYDSKFCWAMSGNDTWGMFHLVESGYNKGSYTEEPIWERALEQIEDEVIDAGYGEEVHTKYQLSYVLPFPETYNVICVYSANKSRYLYLYDKDGKLLNESPKISSKSKISLRENNDISVAIESIESDKKEICYYLLDKKGNCIIYKYYGNYFLLDNIFVQVNNMSYFAYDEKQVILLSINNKIIKDIQKVNTDQYIKELFPNETHIPISKIETVTVSTNYSIISANATLYNGENKNIDIKVDNRTGEPIK